MPQVGNDTVNQTINKDIPKLFKDATHSDTVYYSQTWGTNHDALTWTWKLQLGTPNILMSLTVT